MCICVMMNALAAAMLPLLLSGQHPVARAAPVVPHFLRSGRAASFWSALKAWTSTGHAAETRTAHGHTWTDENRCGRYATVPDNKIAPMLGRQECESGSLWHCWRSCNPVAWAHSRSASPGSWMERGGPEFARHLERERSHYRREMAWGRLLQRQLRDEISARLPDSVVRRTAEPAHCALPRDRPKPCRQSSPSTTRLALPAACTACSTVVLRLYTVQVRPL